MGLKLIPEDLNDDFAGLLIRLPEGKVACSTCGKQLSNITNGRRHFASAHQWNQPATCKICQKSFKNPQTRDSHLRQTHHVSPAMIKNAVRIPK